MTLPHLRFSRDKRGYENTFVVHASARRKGKGRSRILYWFRTPPGVRVGRAALDEEAIRLIEEYNPDVEFDWTRILKGQGAETRPAAPQKDRDYRAERIARRQARAAEKTESAGKAELPESSELTDSSGNTERVEPVELADSHLSGDSVLAVYSDSGDSDVPPRPSLARLGSEGLARLRARYAEVRARISERVPDPARQDELKTQAERLNPDSWVTDAEVTTGLEAYESVFEALRSAVGRPSRRKRRRRRGAGGPEAGGPQASAAEAPAGEPDADHPADDDRDEDL